MWVWIEPVIGISALFVALAAGGTAFWKIWRFLDRWQDALAVLQEIAEQFRPNGGDSLHDRIVNLEGSMSQVQRDIESVLIERPHRESKVRAEVDVEGTEF